MFSIFKQYYTYFYTPFYHTYLIKKIKNYYLNKHTKPPDYCRLKSTVSNGCDKQAHLVR